MSKRLNKSSTQSEQILREIVSFLNESLAAVWYKGLIGPSLKYCAPLLYYSNEYIKKDILKIENRCLKILYRPKVETRPRHNIQFITKRYHYFYILTYFKQINKLVPIIYASLLTLKLKSGTRLGKSEGLMLSKEKYRLYNDLPPNIKLCHDLKSFK